MPQSAKEALLASISPKQPANTLKGLKAQSKALKAELDRLTTPPLSYGVVITVGKEFATVSSDGKLLEVLNPKRLKIKTGDTVRLVESSQIIAKSDWQLPGEICPVKRIIDNKRAEIEYQGADHLVYRGNHPNLQKGDRVVIDGSVSVVISNLGSVNDDYAVTDQQVITWDDIGGCEAAKQELIEAIETPHTHKNIHTFYKKKPIKGILLWGPPGCGKTLLAKAAATAQAQVHGHNVAQGFFSVKGPEVLSRYVGDAELAIRNLFLQGRKFQEEHGYPALIFIDEAEALLSRRGSGISSDVEKTIVPTFLTEMDGFTGSGSLVILATNRPDVLDPAVIRSGRIDRKIQITRPTKVTAREIFAIALKKVPVKQGTTRKKLAAKAVEMLFSDDYPLYEIRVEGKVKRTLGFGLQHICDGAMLSSIIGRASNFAMRRDIANGTTTGVSCGDLGNAVDAEYTENLPLEHKLALGEFTRNLKDEVIDIKKIQLR